MTVSIAKGLALALLATCVAGHSEATDNGDPKMLADQMLSLAAALSEVESSPSQASAANTLLSQARSDVSSAARRLALLSASPNSTLSELDPKIFDQVATALVETRGVCETSSSLRFERVNSLLFATANTFVQLRHPSTAWYILAVSPLHVPPGGGHAVVTVAAVTPDSSDSALLGVSIQGNSPEVTRSSAGLWHFTLPDAIPQQSSTIQLDFPISVRHLMLFSTQTYISARLYVDPKPFFSIEVDTRVDSPKAWVTVDAKSQYVTRADSYHQTVSGVVTAPQLFAQLVGDDITYFSNSAKFVDVHASVVVGGRPCEDCPQARGTYEVSADGMRMAVSLAAISCAAHLVGKPFPQLGYICGGGGSNVEVRAQPTFLVRLRNTPEELNLPPKTVRLSRSSSDGSVGLASNWSSVRLSSTYVDADVPQKDEVILDRSHLSDGSVGGIRPWHGRIEGDRVILTSD